MNGTRERGKLALLDWLAGEGCGTKVSREGRRTVIVATRGNQRRVLRWSTRGSGDFQMSATDHGRLGREDHFWAFVDLTGHEPEVHVVAEDDVRVFLETIFVAARARTGGRRVINNDSTHQRINTRELGVLLSQSRMW